MEQKAKLDSASDTTSQYDAIQLNPKGGCTADGNRGSTAINFLMCAHTTLELSEQQTTLTD